MNEITLKEYETYGADRPVQDLTALSSVKIVQSVFSCSSVVHFRSSNACPVTKRGRVARSL